ncbi:MAG TPA: glycine--tRNA ligase subunit beta, partial [Rhodocyclaceae bacterium]|nr:glycine--tRNA ligase subunit beta [Rhodocyclaceae bacterium]
MSNQNLLVELFVEELPPKALKKLGESFATLLADNLKSQGLASADTAITSFASPRRLAVHVANVAAKSADKSVSQKLMPVAVGLDANGQATPALLKKLASLGADANVVSQLKRQPDGKAEVLFYDSLQAGVPLAEGLQKALSETIAKLPIPKVMGYQLADGWATVSFVRPAHKLVALHGADVVAINVLGLSAGRETLGHRFEAKINPVVIRDADSYATQLRDEGAVIASFAERRAEIVRQLTTAAAKEGLKPIEDEALLDEVTALVERPNVLRGQFESEFLEVPQECLILTMKANQKYFPLLDSAGKLTNKFLIVSNISPADPSAVIGGNERVVRPRLADAKFFFDQDRKKPLESRCEGLKKVIYLNKFGEQGDMFSRVERVCAIAQAIATKLSVDLAAVETAAKL